MSIVGQQFDFLLDVARLINYADAVGVVLTGGELYRTQEQQAVYVSSGRSKTMDSYHLKRLAIDFNFFIAGQLTYDHELITALGAFWESLDGNNRWGGFFKNFKDTPHFERRI